MANEPAIMTAEQQAALIEQVVVQGDLEKLSPAQRVQYYRAVCQSLGLNPLTKPFDYLRLNGKLVLYANRTCTDQLRANQRISIRIVSREVIDDVYVVTASGTTPDGRTDEATGAVAIAGLKGEARANAYMKAETKAKRRLTLSMVGLGWLDETEVDTIPGAQRVQVDLETGEIVGRDAAPPAATGAGKAPAQHPLEAAGLPREALKHLWQWIAANKPGNQWTSREKELYRTVFKALQTALQAGLPGPEMAEWLAAYADQGPATAEQVEAFVAMLATASQSSESPADAATGEDPA
ncbi:MAG: hypothetical protein K6U87_09825 [Firmicutes bacterium]|nr:hypothetical protein [Bacillota bacterium]